MNELIPEAQLYFWVPVVCLGFALAGPVLLLFLRRNLTDKPQKRLTIRYALFAAIVGLVLLAFWKTYNTIEDFYGLDSVKALGINLAIALGLGLVLRLFFNWFCAPGSPASLRPQPRPRPKASRRRKV